MFQLIFENSEYWLSFSAVTVLRLKAMLKFTLQLKFRVLTGTASSVSSRPLFRIEPTLSIAV